ncbi:MAG: hypothetical protein GXX80_12850 [Thermotogaceae bacterium]|nr:hypothetical protein [Thermotogaceae bacterium]
MNDKAELMITVSSFAKKNKIEPRFLHGLIKRYNISPDAIDRQMRFYKPEKLEKLIEKIDEAMKN